MSENIPFRTSGITWALSAILFLSLTGLSHASNLTVFDSAATRLKVAENRQGQTESSADGSSYRRIDTWYDEDLSEGRNWDLKWQISGAEDLFTNTEDTTETDLATLETEEEDGQAGMGSTQRVLAEKSAVFNTDWEKNLWRLDVIAPPTLRTQNNYTIGGRITGTREAARAALSYSTRMGYDFHQGNDDREFTRVRDPGKKQIRHTGEGGKNIRSLPSVTTLVIILLGVLLLLLIGRKLPL